MKYIEERKRSEDLAQILSEEKVRIDSMAEGLEEESKKSLQMEAELEKQLAQFDMERQQYKQALAKEEKRAKDLELELDKLRTEMDVWKESQTRGSPRGVGATPPPPPAKPVNLVAMPTVKPANAPQTSMLCMIIVISYTHYILISASSKQTIFLMSIMLLNANIK